MIANRASPSVTVRQACRGRPARWFGCTARASANWPASWPLIERICVREIIVLVTSGTVTSSGLAEQRLPRGVIHQFVPIDVPFFVRRFLDHWQPDLALFVESELWPNIMIETSDAACR